MFCTSFSFSCCSFWGRIKPSILTSGKIFVLLRCQGCYFCLRLLHHLLIAKIRSEGDRRKILPFSGHFRITVIKEKMRSQKFWRTHFYSVILYSSYYSTTDTEIKTQMLHAKIWFSIMALWLVSWCAGYE